jgi:CDP-diacylglycerol--glycerol-3-phosphate 3-phosphatidyltransferase
MVASVDLRRNLNPANLLTTSRVLLVVPVVALIDRSTSEDSFVAGVIFAAAAVTDFLDGRMARALRCTTSFGAAFDPVADKVLVLATMLALVLQGELPAALVAALFIRDAAITLLRAIRRTGGSLQSSKTAKVKTGILMASLTGVLLGPSIGSQVTLTAWALLVVATALSITTAIDYARRTIAKSAGRQAVITR